MMNANLLTPDEAAEYVGLKATTLAKLRSVGGGPVFTRIGGGRGGRVYYLRGDLDAYLTSRRLHSTAGLPGRTGEPHR